MIQVIPSDTLDKFNCARRFYENIVPSYTVYNVECPDHILRKFTEDGLYLVSFSLNHQELVVYRPTWLSYSYTGDDFDAEQLPPKYNKFESFFTQLYTVSLTSIGELICKDFFLYIESKKFGLFATSTAQVHDAPAVGGAIQGVPSIDKITFHLLRMEDGVILDERVNPAGNSLLHNQSIPENSFLSGIKQRLLSFIFRKICNEEQDPAMRMQYLKKKFYFHFQDYVNLVIWKVSRTAENHPAFFAIYNMETTEIVSFYQNSEVELYLMVELFCDYFHPSSANSLNMNFISSHSNNIHACEQLKYNRNKASNFSQFVKKILSTLPVPCQSLSPSPYFDQTLFRFDEKLISAIERHRQSTDHPIKFISRRQPNILKFKIKPGRVVLLTITASFLFLCCIVRSSYKNCSSSGPEAGNTDTRTKKISSFLFHPILPLVLSVQQTLFLQPSVVNIHFRR
ncbi:hypothetical protein Leryth_008805 [Lithospermum erythrorhizon]|nr:hypothetical protein Leryth_008805 [Lithospermum erythrorhizon]